MHHRRPTRGLKLDSCSSDEKGAGFLVRKSETRGGGLFFFIIATPATASLTIPCQDTRESLLAALPRQHPRNMAVVRPCSLPDAASRPS